MKKSCKYCGGIHEVGYICDRKPLFTYTKSSPEDVFRSSYDWKQKRTHILKRDYYLCRFCLSQGKVNTERLSVHHIIPLKYNSSLRLDDENLITLCTLHHEQAEKGEILADTLKKLIPPTFPD